MKSLLYWNPHSIWSLPMQWLSQKAHHPPTKILFWTVPSKSNWQRLRAKEASRRSWAEADSVYFSQCLFVYLFVPSWNTLFRRSWRLLVKPGSSYIPMQWQFHHEYFRPKNFWQKNYLCWKKLLANIFFAQKNLCTIFFGRIQKVWPKFFEPKYIFGQKKFDAKQKIFWAKNNFGKIKIGQKKFQLHFYWPKKCLAKSTTVKKLKILKSNSWKV